MNRLIKKSLITLGAVTAITATAGVVQAAEEQFFPVLVYRTGAYAANGAPWANGYVDYLKLTNERGGINGVKATFEECEFGYATDRGVECYERMKHKNGGATVIQPLSTGVTFALSAKSAVDKVPLITAGYGLSESEAGLTFTWNFPLLGTYWVGADVGIQFMGQKAGGLDKLKGKTIALVYHDSPYGKEPIPLLKARAKMHGFNLMLLPVAHPGVEQKATWLQIRQKRPDWVLLWGWGVMNSAAIKEAQATGFPRDRMLGIWWAGAEPDVRGVGSGAVGYSAMTLQHGAEKGSAVVKDILAKVHAKNNGTGPKDEVGEVLYMRGLLSAMLAVEGVKRAQEHFGKGKRMTGSQVRWGLENLDLTQGKLNNLGLGKVMRPVKTSCDDHLGSSWVRIHQWDGKQWNFISNWMQADRKVTGPLVKAGAEKYAREKGLTPRTLDLCK